MAGKTFTSISAVLKYLEQNMVINLEKIGEEIAGVLKNYVNLNWYQYMDNKKDATGGYERTMDILNSISVTKARPLGNGAYEVKIFFDETKIRMIEYDGLFNAHLSVDGTGMYQGMSIPQWVVYWMNYGQNSPLYSYPGVGFLEETIEWTENDRYHINRMIELLEMKGFKCV